MDKFINSMSIVIKHSNHDFIHGLTNSDRDERVPEGLDYESKTYLREFANPIMSKNGFRVEECAVVEMNRLIFENLRNQPNNQSFKEFYAAVADVSDIVTELNNSGHGDAAKSAQYILKNFLSFFFDKKLLNETPINEWANIVKTADTRQDIKICQFLKPPMFEMRGLVLNEEAPTPTSYKRVMTPEENDDYYARLLEQNLIKMVGAYDVFAKLHESANYDLNDSLKQVSDIITNAANNGCSNDNHKQALPRIVPAKVDPALYKKRDIKNDGFNYTHIIKTAPNITYAQLEGPLADETQHPEQLRISKYLVWRFVS